MPSIGASMLFSRSVPGATSASCTYVRDTLPIEHILSRTSEHPAHLQRMRFALCCIQAAATVTTSHRAARYALAQTPTDIYNRIYSPVVSGTATCTPKSLSPELDARIYIVLPLQT